MGVSGYDITARDYRADRTQDYELSILTGVDSFAYIIRHRTENKLLAYAARTLDRQPLTDVVAADPRLHEQRYDRTVLGWVGAEMTLVPAELFAADNPAAYLEQLTTIGLDDEVRHEHRPDLGGALVYAARRDDLHAAEGQLRVTRTHHYAGGLLTTWGNRARRLGRRTVSCNLRGGRLFIAGHDKGRLEYFNTFPFDNSQDGVYYVLLAYQRCNWPADEVTLFASGELTAEGELYRQFSRYLADIQFGNHPNPPAVPPEMAGIPPHTYYDLLSLG